MGQWIDKVYDLNDGTGNVATKWKIMSTGFNADKGILVFSLGGFLDDTRTKPIVIKSFPINLNSGFILPEEIGDLEAAVGAILMRLPFFSGESMQTRLISSPAEGGSSNGASLYDPNTGFRIPNAFLPKKEEPEETDIVEMRMVGSADRPPSVVLNDPANVDPMDAERTIDDGKEVDGKEKEVESKESFGSFLNPFLWLAGASGMAAAMTYFVMRFV